MSNYYKKKPLTKKSKQKIKWIANLMMDGLGMAFIAHHLKLTRQHIWGLIQLGRLHNYIPDIDYCHIQKQVVINKIRLMRLLNIQPQHIYKQVGISKSHYYRLRELPIEPKLSWILVRLTENEFMGGQLFYKSDELFIRLMDDKTAEVYTTPDVKYTDNVKKLTNKCILVDAYPLFTMLRQPTHNPFFQLTNISPQIDMNDEES